MLGKTELEGLTVKSALGGRLTRGFTMSGFLSKTELESLLAGAVRTRVINGGAAGNHMVSGIKVGDALRAVLKLDLSASFSGTPVADHSHTENTAATYTQNASTVAGGGHTPAGAISRAWSVADLTGEFSITGDNTINNAGGTDTTGAVLVVVYEDLTP